MSLDQDEIDALAQAGGVVLRWVVLALGFVVLARAACGCGGSEFLVDVFGDAGGDPRWVDGNTASDSVLADAPSSTGPQSPNDGRAVLARDPSDDAGASMRDAGTSPPLEAAPAPAADAADEPPPPPPPPPPALCCLTPCSGSSPAAITCGNGAAWTCAAGSCSDRACAAGQVCTWMAGACTGRVEVCP
jgi:hypothetical protein